MDTTIEAVIAAAIKVVEAWEKGGCKVTHDYLMPEYKVLHKSVAAYRKQEQTSTYKDIASRLTSEDK